MTLREYLSKKGNGVLVSIEEHLEWVLINPLKNATGKLFTKKNNMFFTLNDKEENCSKWLDSKIIACKNIIKCDNIFFRYLARKN